VSVNSADPEPEGSAASAKARLLQSTAHLVGQLSLADELIAERRAEAAGEAIQTA
jgi:hypothetical protein